jgi:hypothetical protein
MALQAYLATPPILMCAPSACTSSGITLPCEPGPTPGPTPSSLLRTVALPELKFARAATVASTVSVCTASMS